MTASDHMRYFQINTLGDDIDKSLAFADCGIENYSGEGRLYRGERAGSEYPPDARIYLQIESPGLKLRSLLGNTACYLIINTELKTILETLDLGQVEILPFTLYDHRKRPLSKDYWIVNPLGTFDCVNRAASEIEFWDEDPTKIVGVDKLVFDAKKLEGAPDLFRVPESPYEYFCSQRVPMAWQHKGFTNLFMDEIEVV